MVQSPSWEANWFAASQEIPRISQNPKFHYRTHKCPPTVSILGQPNPVHIPTSHLLEIHSNFIHPSMPRSPQWSPSLRFPHQEPIHTPLFTHMCHMRSPLHFSRFYHPYKCCIWNRYCALLIAGLFDVFCIVHFNVLRLNLILCFMCYVCTHHRERLPVPCPVPVIKSTLWLFVTLRHHHARHKVQE